MNLPAISVVIPLYNAEKYIADCLNSLLVQTFQDFEVIVVDDCSTDNSAAIVQSYLEKFDGRLRLTRTKKNSGNTGYSARNKGFNFSRGEYVYFMDADDMIDENALEIFYTAAKNFNADVVFSGAYYIFGDGEVTLRRDKKCQRLFDGGNTQPILTIDAPDKNLRELFGGGTLFWAAWTKFVSRDFLIRNEITFPEILSGGDFVWAIEIFCHAERYLRISDAVYFYRDAPESRTRKQSAADKQIVTWISAFIAWSKALKNLADKLKILRDNPDYCYSALNLWLYACFNCCAAARFQVQSERVYQILRDNLPDKDNDFALMIPFLFGVIDSLQKDFQNDKED